MNWLSCEVPKNSFSAATTGRMLISVCGRDRLDVLGRHPLAHDPLHAARPGAQLVLDQLADRAHAPVAEVVDVVGLDDDGLALRVSTALLSATVSSVRPSCSSTM
jgi:hypothetical protein